MIDVEGRPGGRGSLIGFVHPASFGGGLLIHFVEPQVDGGDSAFLRWVDKVLSR